MTKIFAHLMKEVIAPGFCLSCGACAASCPSLVLQVVDEKAVIRGRCDACDICYHQCPQTVGQAELESCVFGRNAAASEVLGIYGRAFSARASNPEIYAHCQDGGVVTALLAALLKADFIDGAVVMGASDEWQPVPKVAIIHQDLLECGGTKYSRGAALVGMRDAVDLYSLERLAMVGTPCQIKALRRMQTNERATYRLTDAIKLSVGLFCMEAFPYERFFRRVVEEELGIKLAEIEKFDIKRGRFIIYRRRKPRRELAVDALRQFVDVPCKLCADFAAELADISVGAVGSPLNYSTVLLRTPIGFEAFELARRARALEVRPMEEVRPGIEAVRRTAEMKKQASKKEIERRSKLGMPLPPWLQASAQS